ncbi:hypothetical protein [Aquiflexum balticum]|nr:hypothetical protein [Aquiflexum balticum]
MKKLLYSLPLIAFIFLSSSVFSQENLLYKSVQDAKTLELDFQAIPSAFTQAPEIREILDHFESLGEVDFFHYDKNIYDGFSEAVSLNLPLKTGQLQLELLEVPASFYNYEIVTSDGKRLSASKGIKHYRGIVKDD